MDATFLAAVVERHAAALALYARQWAAAPEDVVQEALVKLALRPAPPEPLAPWLFATVRNLARTAARSEQRRRRHEAEAGRLQRAWFVAPEGAALDAATVAGVLNQLPDEQREAITLHLWGELSFADAAAVMGCSVSTAHRWFQAGLESLREVGTMSTGMNDLAAALRELRPAPVPEGALLFEAGRAAGVKSARRWKAATAAVSAAAAVLAAVLVLRPEPAPRLHVVHLVPAVSAEHDPEAAAEPALPSARPLPPWLRHHDVRLEPASDGAEGPAESPQPLRAGDRYKVLSSGRAYPGG